MSRKYFFLAVNTGLAVGGVPDDRCRAFYRDRSGNGLHCTIVGNVVTPGGDPSNSSCAEISQDGAWRQLAEAIAERGASPGIQLASAWPGYIGMTRFIARTPVDPLRFYKEVAANLSVKDWVKTYDELRLATELAVDAGFRHIQLHAAHGYLFNLFIDRRLSRCADEALHSIERWLRELSGIGVETSIRFSMRSGYQEFDDQGRYDVMDSLVELGPDYLDASSGFYNVDKRLIYPYRERELSQRADDNLDAAKRHPSMNFILSGKSAFAWDTSLPDNIHIGICRDLIANPEFMRVRGNGCENRMRCHYYSRGESHLTCGRWERD